MSSPVYETTIVFVPGLRDHVEDHWQTLLAAKLPRAACVPRLGRDVLSCDAWVAALDATIAALEGPIYLAAHSAGVIMVAHWVRRCFRPIAGALLATPPDLAAPLPEGYPTREALVDNGWLPVPRVTFPFPSIVAASENDPLGRFDRAADLAAGWGSRLHNAGAVGHLNAASGFGEWPEAVALLRELGAPQWALAAQD